MKKIVSVEATICDTCGKSGALYQCNACGKDFCYDCANGGAGKKFPHGVHFSGSGDGFFCNACLATELPPEKSKLLMAYKKITALRHEEAGWYEDFQERSKTAENELQALFVRK